MSGLLRREIKQTRPFLRPEEEAFLNLQRTTNVLTQAFARHLKGHGVTLSQYNVLRILGGAWPEALPCSEVGARMVTPVPDVTRLLDRLEAAGLVSRQRDAGDRRVVNVGITEAGRGLLEEIREPLARRFEELLGHLDDGKLATLVELLEAARGAV